MPKALKTFWIIWNPTYPAPPQVRFDTEQEARDVAEAMALRHR